MYIRGRERVSKIKQKTVITNVGRVLREKRECIEWPLLKTIRGKAEQSEEDDGAKCGGERKIKPRKSRPGSLVGKKFSRSARNLSKLSV